MEVRRAPAVAAAILAIAFGACTSNVVGTGNPPAGGTSGNNPVGTSSGAQGSSGVTGGTACSNVAGVWDVSSCGTSDTCTIRQTECEITLTCKRSSFRGHVDGKDFTYSGVGDLGYEVTCSGSMLTASVASGSCVPDNPADPQPCSFSAQRR